MTDLWTSWAFLMNKGTPLYLLSKTGQNFLPYKMRALSFIQRYTVHLHVHIECTYANNAHMLKKRARVSHSCLTAISI